MDKNDLAVLLVDAPAGEVDQIHRLLYEWSVGPDDSFPVQLVLLTKAQWRIAACLPRVMNDSRKLIEQHLNEYRRHSKATAEDFASTFKQQAAGIKTVVETHAKNTEQAAKQTRLELDDAEEVARRVKTLMEYASTEWQDIKTSTKIQRDQLQQVSNDLQDRFAWRTVVWWAAWTLAVFGLGYCAGLGGFRGH